MVDRINGKLAQVIGGSELDPAEARGADANIYSQIIILLNQSRLIKSNPSSNLAPYSKIIENIKTKRA